MIYMRVSFFSTTCYFLLALIISGCTVSGQPKYSSTPKYSRKDKKKATRIAASNKLEVHTKDERSFWDLFRNRQKAMALRCPDKSQKKKKDKIRIETETEEVGEPRLPKPVMLETAKQSIHFDIIKLSEKRLDIPAFKQFKNNMTDFTADGEEQFKAILEKIRDYLGDNTDGHGVTLRIVGSASQIPTSFDPSKPNNNIRPDGSSIPGQTSIENNVTLAQARALELAKKIKRVFYKIKIETPKLSEITLGATPWDSEAQRRLNWAVHHGTRSDLDSVYAPFQKEQFVKVESKEKHTRTVKPEALKMYTLTMNPKHYHSDNSIHAFVTSPFIISRETHDLVGEKLVFESVEERNSFLEENDLHIRHIKMNGEERWYLLHGEAELSTMNITDEYERILTQYTLEIVSTNDKAHLRKIITDHYLALHNN